MGMIETRAGGAAGRTTIHEVAAITEIILEEARRADEPFLAYLLELALGEAAAIAANMGEAYGPSRLRGALGLVARDGSPPPSIHGPM